MFLPFSTSFTSFTRKRVSFADVFHVFHVFRTFMCISSLSGSKCVRTMPLGASKAKRNKQAEKMKHAFFDLPPPAKLNDRQLYSAPLPPCQPPHPHKASTSHTHHIPLNVRGQRRASTPESCFRTLQVHMQGDDSARGTIGCTYLRWRSAFLCRVAMFGRFPSTSSRPSSSIPLSLATPSA